MPKVPKSSSRRNAGSQNQEPDSISQRQTAEPWRQFATRMNLGRPQQQTHAPSHRVQVPILPNGPTPWTDIVPTGGVQHLPYPGMTIGIPPQGPANVSAQALPRGFDDIPADQHPEVLVMFNAMTDDSCPEQQNNTRAYNLVNTLAVFNKFYLSTGPNPPQTLLQLAHAYESPEVQGLLRNFSAPEVGRSAALVITPALKWLACSNNGVTPRHRPIPSLAHLYNKDMVEQLKWTRLKSASLQSRAQAQHPPALMVSAPDTSEPQVKVEERAPFTAEPRMNPVPLDQARTAYEDELGLRCDLTLGEPKWLGEGEHVMVMNHRMEPDPKMEAAFPLRDPKNPFFRVHPDYANEAGGVADKVAVEQVSISKTYLNYLEELAKADLHERLGGVAPEQIAPLVARIELDVRAEMQRLIRGDEPDPPRCFAERYTPEHNLPACEQVFVDQRQFGLFAHEFAPEERPTLANGKILGLYVGALNRTPTQMREYAQEHPGSSSYEMAVVMATKESSRRGKLTHVKAKPKEVCMAALGAANSIPFANTALDPHAARPTYDHARINAEFVPFDLKIADRTGRLRNETVVALLALENLYVDSNPRRDVRVSYGDKYMPHFEEQPVRDRPVAVKLEPED